MKIRLFKKGRKPKTGGSGLFAGEGSLQRRLYRSYREYLDHQGEKLFKARNAIERSDLEYERIIRRQFA